MTSAPTQTALATTSLPLLEDRGSTPAPSSETVPEEEEGGESPPSAAPTNPPSMFSTSMAPPRPTPAGQEVLEELITTTAPTITEEPEDVEDITTFTPDFDVDDFVGKSSTQVESVPPRGDTFPGPSDTRETPETTDSLSELTDEPDDQSIIQVGTIRPDVPIPPSPSTEPMFAVGKTEETIPDFGITTEKTDVTDTPTESPELTSEEVFSSSEVTSVPEDHSTTPLPDYDPSVDEIETDWPVEGLSPMLPTQTVHEELSTAPPDSPVSDGTAITTPVATDTTFMCNTRPGTTALPEMTTAAAQPKSPTPAVVYKEETSKTTPVTASTVFIDSGSSAEDATSSSSVQVIDESAIHIPEDKGETMIEEEDTTTDIDSEFFTSKPIASAAADLTTGPSAVVPDGQFTQVTTVTHMQNGSGKTSFGTFQALFHVGLLGRL